MAEIEGDASRAIGEGQRPVWLFSLDSEGFAAAPMTTGGLKAYFNRYSACADSSSIELVHFLRRDEIPTWKQNWLDDQLPIARNALKRGQQPVAGFSMYTWNAAEFLELAAFLKETCPELLTVAGGPHVQQAEDYLFNEAIEVVALGEGEVTLQQWLDCTERGGWHAIPGLAFLGEQGELIETEPRTRTRVLDELPSALEVIDLCDEDGLPRYHSVAYETSRGCPFKCAFCEWGTGAIGTKMYQFSMERIRRDWETMTANGIRDIWLADSNFGALREDLDKAKLIVELRQQTGLPVSFATSWSKKHSPRVQEIALLLHQHGLLPHYQLALQTLTPLALELSNRKNMSANKYEPIAKQMAQAGVPIAAELIWGLPGDTLASFEANLDKLLATFPNINMFGYTLLPGTEFYEKRHEYEIDTIPVAGYGKAKGEYVVGCHTFLRTEGMEGYFLITAHALLMHGHIMPLTTRLLALEGQVPVSALLRRVLEGLIEAFADGLEGLNASDRMTVYENRNSIYVEVLTNQELCYGVVGRTITRWLTRHETDPVLLERVRKTLELDRALCPRVGGKQQLKIELSFDGFAVKRALDAMELPDPLAFAEQSLSLPLEHPGGVGEILTGPEAGQWMCGEIVAAV